MTRFPVQPLLDAGRSTNPKVKNRENDSTRATVAQLVGIHRDTLRKWERRGGLTPWAADRAACALGLHPASIWADWYAA